MIQWRPKTLKMNGMFSWWPTPISENLNRVTSEIDMVWVDVARAHFLRSSRHFSREKKGSTGLLPNPIWQTIRESGLRVRHWQVRRRGDTSSCMLRQVDCVNISTKYYGTAVPRGLSLRLSEVYSHRANNLKLNIYWSRHLPLLIFKYTDHEFVMSNREGWLMNEHGPCERWWEGFSVWLLLDVEHWTLNIEYWTCKTASHRHLLLKDGYRMHLILTPITHGHFPYPPLLKTSRSPNNC